MVSTNDIRPGQSLIIEGTIYLILEYQHVKPGKGKAFVKTKLKNLSDGGVVDKTFRADENVEQACPGICLATDAILLIFNVFIQIFPRVLTVFKLLEKLLSFIISWVDFCNRSITGIVFILIPTCFKTLQTEFK